MKNTLLGSIYSALAASIWGGIKGCSIVYTPIRAGVDAIFSPIIALLIMVL